MTTRQYDPDDYDYDPDEPKIKVTTQACVVCGKSEVVEVPQKRYRQWNALITFKRPRTIEEALPELTADERQLLQTGIHDKCWDELL